MNRQHLDAVRSNTCYPAFRGVIQVFTLIGYLVAVVVAGVGVMSGQPGTIAIAVGIAIVLALFFRVAQEVSFMLADIADVTIDSSARSVSPTPVAASQPVLRTATPMNDEAAMALYGITFDGERYRFRDFRYDKLSDAINYAKRQVTPS